ncbi:hypothetical protein Agabi119p4_6993 [Agaricus bisporus var. burnettii]|uniref:Uncharacterized protein n=1 Tax=Agaricus bisporus var. burnettii TaxID=192524 RepID=A0A8H7KFT7_AGABI|nr:hypothetical protein Agabi119p4_6993 [Agaricus bisporus var. burnettii]
MDIKFMGSGWVANAILYYITNYITKTQIPLHVAYTSLKVAAQKLSEINSDSVDHESSAKALLQKSGFALLSNQELSSQQVASYLIGLPDYYTSHAYRNFYWLPFENYISSQIPDAELEVESTDTNSDELYDSFPNSVTGEQNGNDSTDFVAIQGDGMGNLTTAAGKVADYVYCPIEFECMNLFDFVSYVDVVKISNATFDYGHQHRNLFQFLSLHPSYQTHGTRKRLPSTKFVPVPCGSQLPKRKDPAQYKRYCRTMLMLFKPWRHANQLKIDSGWDSSFEVFINSASLEIKTKLKNIDLLQQCKDIGIEEAQNRRKSSNSFLSQFQESASVDESDLSSELETQALDILEHITSTQSYQSNKIEKSKKNY